MKKEENITPRGSKSLKEKSRTFKPRVPSSLENIIENLPPLMSAVIIVYFFYLGIPKLKEKIDPVDWLGFFGILFLFLGVVAFLNIMVVPKILTRIISEKEKEDRDTEILITSSPFFKTAGVLTAIGTGFLILSILLSIWLKLS